MIFTIDFSVDENFSIGPEEESIPVCDEIAINNYYFHYPGEYRMSFCIKARNLHAAIELTYQKWKNFCKYTKENSRLPHPSEI